MIDIIVYVNESTSLKFSDYKTWEDLKNKIIDILGCEEHEVLERKYTIELEEFEDFISETNRIDRLYEGYKNLMEFEDPEVILTYIMLEGEELYYKDIMFDALDAYFGKYEDPWDAAYDLLRDVLDMTRSQALYVLNDLDCVDKIIKDNFEIYNGIYFLK